MLVVVVVFRRQSLQGQGGLDILGNPAGTTITGVPTRFPIQTLSQSAALPMKASTIKLSRPFRISFPFDAFIGNAVIDHLRSINKTIN